MVGLDNAHTDGVAVGALCVPTVCAALLASGSQCALRPFWLVCSFSMFVLLRRCSFRPAHSIASAVVWAAVIAVVVGPYGIGRFKQPAKMLTMHNSEHNAHAWLVSQIENTLVNLIRYNGYNVLHSRP
jgi:hypothetical protein